MEDLSIRRAGEQDIPALDRLLYQVHRVHSDARPDLFVPGAKKYTDAELRAILAGDSTPVFVAERDGAVLGYAFCVLQDPPHGNMTPVRTLYLDDLCVDAHARGAGVGTALYRFELDYARACGCHNVTLNVWAGNPGAQRFYEALGMHVQKTCMEQIL